MVPFQYRVGFADLILSDGVFVQHLLSKTHMKMIVPSLDVWCTSSESFGRTLSRYAPESPYNGSGSRQGCSPYPVDGHDSGTRRVHSGSGPRRGTLEFCFLLLFMHWDTTATIHQNKLHCAGDTPETRHSGGPYPTTRSHEHSFQCLTPILLSSDHLFVHTRSDSLVHRFWTLFHE